jgi:hypothetical protein
MWEWLLTHWNVVLEVGQSIIGLGLLSALVAYMLRVWEDRRARKRKLRGMLRLLDSEVERNIRELKRYEAHPQTITDGTGGHSLGTKSWDAVRVAISEHLNSREFADLTSRYNHVEELKKGLLDYNGRKYQEHSGQDR